MDFVMNLMSIILLLCHVIIIRLVQKILSMRRPCRVPFSKEKEQHSLRYHKRQG